MAKQYPRSLAWDHRFQLSIEADLHHAEEHWLPGRAEVIELCPASMRVGKILRLSGPRRYLVDASVEPQPGTVNGMVIFLRMGDGRWLPALLLHAEPQPTVGQALGAAWKEARRKKREKERRLRRMMDGPS